MGSSLGASPASSVTQVEALDLQRCCEDTVGVRAALTLNMLHQAVLSTEGNSYLCERGHHPSCICA